MNIVLLHGLAGSHRYFATLVPILERDGHRVSTFDLIGFGTNKNRGKEYTLAEHLAWIDQNSIHTFGSEHVVMLGHSLGGIFALAWAAANTARCKGVILLNTHLADSTQEIRLDIQRRKTSWGNMMIMFPKMSHVACLVLCQNHAMRLLWPFKPAHISDASFHDYTEHTWRSVSKTFHHVYIGCPGTPLVAGLRGVPVLNVFGLRDGVFARPIEQEQVTNVGLDAGHYALEQQPQATLTAIRAFLKELEAGRSA